MLSTITFSSLNGRAYEINKLNAVLLTNILTALNAKLDLIKEAQELVRAEDYNKYTNTILKDIKEAQKLLNRVNGYKNITFKYKKDCDVSERVLEIVFPKGTRKTFKDDWLKSNGLPTESVFYYPDLFEECPSDAHAVLVNHKANICTIEFLLDV